MNAVALIAEDEPLLAQALANALRRQWPELTLLPVATDGQGAVESALTHLPDVLFFDIQMPDTNGLDAAETVLDRWPDERPMPLLVFVTAYDAYALAAFEHAAVDYVLKPVQADRLAETCGRLLRQLGWRDAPPQDAPSPLQNSDMAAAARAQLAQEEPLHFLQVAVGAGLRMVPVDDVLCFEAADKYVRVLTADTASSEMLIRTPLRELLPRLDAQRFWQIHRSAVVNVAAIEQVVRHNGRLRVHLRGRPETLEVSRMYAHRFKPM